MASTPAPERPNQNQRSQGGVALFMVVSAVAVLSLLVTEFTYISQLNQKIAYDALDQVKVHYLAKSALKISLLRLKAYQTVKSMAGKEGVGAAIPRTIIEKIWNFPFFFPFPTNVPGMTVNEKDTIEKFQKESALEGNFSAAIESESSKYNLNMLLSPFVPKATASPTPDDSKKDREKDPSATASPVPFDPDAAQKSLTDYLQQLLTNKFESDPDFAEEYRDLRVEELTENIRAWVDPTHQRAYVPSNEQIAMKKAPFYSLSELHMVPGFTDELYELFAPSLTVSTTPGINVNTMTEVTLRAIVPNVTVEEAQEFIKTRDSEEADGTFKAAEDFFKYINTNFAAYRSQPAIDQLKEELQKRNVRLVTDETQFKITVQARVNQSARLIEAWVTLSDSTTAAKPPGGPPASPGAPAGEPPQASKGKSSRETGLKITFMRIL